MYEQGKKLEKYITIQRDEEQEAQMISDLDCFREMLMNWEKAKNTKAQRGLIVEMKKRDNQKGTMTDYVWITINPADGKEDEFIKYVKKFMTRPCMKGEYTFEQRGEVEGDYHGIHIHALVRNYPNLTRDCVRGFAKFCDRNHIKVMKCVEEDIIKRQNYMKGIKKDGSKQEKCQNDLKMREYYKLDHFYTC